MPRVEFQFNQPERVSLKFSDGINKAHPEFGLYVLYTLADGRTMALPPDVAQSIRELRLKPGEEFLVCKRKQDGRVAWHVYRPEAQIDLKARLSASVKAAERRQDAPERPARIQPSPAPAPTPQAANAPQGTGTYGPVARPVPVSVKIPYNVAFREITMFVSRELDAVGEQWDAHSKQAAVCTLFIQAARDGKLGMWER